MKKLSMLAILVAGSALHGCASTTDVLARQPSEVLNSEKNYLDVAACIGDLNNMSVQERGDGSRVVAVKAMAGNVGAVYTVKPNGNGSIVELRQPGIMDVSKYKRCL